MVQNLPVVGSNVPQRGTSRSKQIWTKLLQTKGWTVLGEIPNVPKAVVIGAPHTSNFDALVGIESAMALGLNVRIMVKDTYNRPPFRGLVRWLKMIPVDRSSAQGLVEQLRDNFAKNDKFWIFIAPEGTRTSAPTWKSGFYRIACAAQVPIVVTGFDYKNKAIVFLGLFEPTGDFEVDLPNILAFYPNMNGANPELHSLPLRDIITHH